VVYEHADVAIRPMIAKVNNLYLRRIDAFSDVFFDTTADEEKKWDGRVLFEEREHMFEEVFHTLSVAAFVKSVQDDKVRRRPMGGLMR
jgi:hypothetical protein